MEINREGLELIKRFEGLRLEAYQDVAGIWTIGYGHIRTARPGMKITEAEAERLLREDLRDAERAVSDLVKVPINENEFSALVSLVFNIGRGAFSRSTTLRRLNAGDRQGAADAIELWNKATVDGKKTVIPGLVRRRSAEKALFLKPAPGAMQADRPAPSAPPPPRPAEPSRPAPTPDVATRSPVPAENGPDSRVTPVESGGGISVSPGAAVAGAGGVAAAGTGAVIVAQPDSPLAERVTTFTETYGSEITVLLAGLIFLAALYAMSLLLEGGSGRRG